jgi:transcriptional regulator with XRE-family HTH domain
MGSEFGIKIRRLREQAGLSQEALAGLAGISREWLAKIESGKNPRLSVVIRVAAALAKCLPEVTIADLFEGYEGILPARPTPLRLGSYADRRLALSHSSLPALVDGPSPRFGQDPLATHPDSVSKLDEGLTALGVTGELGQANALSLGAWIKSTNTSDEIIEYLGTVTSIATRDHVYLPTATVLSKVLRIHQQIRAVLQGGRQRVRQSRDLFRIDAGLLAHICLLFGDIHRDEVARAYGAVAMLAANEAGCTPAEAFSAQAQIARWRHRYTEAADLASRGFACSPPTSIRVLLACQEANAAALAGDVRRARQSLAQAEAARDAIEDGLDSVWSCPPARYALYRLSVALHSGDAKAALSEADVAEAAWVPDQPKPFGTWAHLRIAAGHAHLMSGSVDGAAEQIDPVLKLPSEYRLATLTEHMATIEQLLQSGRFRGSGEAELLRDRIGEFNRNPVWRRQ